MKRRAQVAGRGYVPRPTLADDARALLLSEYGTVGPARCRYTLPLLPEAPRRAVEHEPAPPEVQRDLFAP